MAERLNDQINYEFYSSYIYLSMAAYFKSQNLNGFAHWMFQQSEEERGHGMKIFSYLEDQDRAVRLQGIKQPQTTYASALAVFEESLKHEQTVTSKIGEIVNLAFEERDHATRVFLDWFVKEQVEEESSVRAVIDRLKAVKDSAPGLLILDRELAARGA